MQGSYFHRIGRWTAASLAASLLAAVAGCPQGPSGGSSNSNLNRNGNVNVNDNANSNSNLNLNDNADTNGVELGVEIPIPNEGAAHVATGTQVTYTANPPASGPHWPATAAPGFYESPIEEEEWIHSLEHGYVVVLFDCDGECDAELLDQLEALVDAAPPSPTFDYAKIVVTPYDGLPEPALITAIAWDAQFHLDRFDEQALLDFYGRHLDRGPELAP